MIDDSFNVSLIGGVEVDEIEPRNADKMHASKQNSTSLRTMSIATNKKKKLTARSGKMCDQYNEKRCLTDDSIDDEQFDFTIQTNN